jgi:peptidoglycan/LPS O-acetylase OafA/YrhL
VHRPALDGLRAVAVLLVMAFHAGVPWAQGGYLGVELFFVLSGYLITSLLVGDVSAQGRLQLGRFWERRARRLLPALFVVVIVVAIDQALGGASRAVPGFGGDGLSTLFYVANWHEIWAGNGYFAQMALVSPLQHTWSLAIEEQFYLIWPLVVLGVLRVARERARAVLLVVASAGAIASAVAMALLYRGGAGLDRVYYGTDTRAQGILVGAALALALAGRRAATQEGSRARGPLLAVIGVAGAAGVAITTATVGAEPGWLFRGGFLAFDVAAAAMIRAASSRTATFSPVRELLSLAPLRAVGLISYGLYLWHFPLFLWLTVSSTGVGGWELLVTRFAATFAVSIVSYFVIEQPIRRRRLPVRATQVALTAAAAVSLATLWVAVDATTVSSVQPPTSLRTTTTVAAPGTPTVPGTGKTCRYPVGPTYKKFVFHTCPPIRALVVGDSVGLTVGVEIALKEQAYGTLVDDQAIIGCSFSVQGVNDELGTTYGPPNPACLSELQTWHADEVNHHDGVAIVEMGYWDEMNWRWGSTDVSLGVPAYDAAERQRMTALAQALGAGGRQVLFLSVPMMNPGPWPNGQPPPQGSTARTLEINALIRSVAEHSGPNVHFLSIAPAVTPNGVYTQNVGGSICRMPDGVHFWMGPKGVYVQTPCGAALQALVLGDVRGIVANAAAAAAATHR